MAFKPADVIFSSFESAFNGGSLYEIRGRLEKGDCAAVRLFDCSLELDPFQQLSASFTVREANSTTIVQRRQTVRCFGEETLRIHKVGNSVRAPELCGCTYLPPPLRTPYRRYKIGFFAVSGVLEG